MPLSIAKGGLYEAAQDVLLPSAARTATGASDSFNVGGVVTGIVVEIDVTAVAGTSPTLDLDLVDSFDGVNWNKVADVNAANIIATGRTVLRLNLTGTPCTNRLRLAYTIGGTAPSFTFAVNAYLIRA